jgi:hypothetical protein
MALAAYFILRGEDHWVVRFGKRNYGHDSLTSAVTAAIKAARTSSENGHDAQVLVQWPDGSWVVSWTTEENFKLGPAGASREVQLRPPVPGHDRSS